MHHKLIEPKKNVIIDRWWMDRGSKKKRWMDDQLKELKQRWNNSWTETVLKKIGWRINICLIGASLVYNLGALWTGSGFERENELPSDQRTQTAHLLEVSSVKHKPIHQSWDSEPLIVYSLFVENLACAFWRIVLRIYHPSAECSTPLPGDSFGNRAQLFRAMWRCVCLALLTLLLFPSSI